MRNLFTVAVAILFASLTGFAQQARGKWLIGGGIESSSINSTTTNPTRENKFSQLSINPKVGYFFADRWAVGLGLGYAFQNQKDSALYKGRGYNAAVFVRYYQPIGEKLALFGELNGIGYGAGNVTRTFVGSSLTQESTYRNFSVGAFIRPGIVYFITPKIGLETSFNGLSLGYFNNKNTGELRNVPASRSELTSDGFTASLNFNYQFNLSVLFYLGG